MTRTTDPTQVQPQGIEGRVALVTGGAVRVGRAVALHLAAAGMDVAVTYRRSGAEARRVTSEIEGMGRRAAAIEIDLARPDAADELFEKFAANFDGLHALVNNASTFIASAMGAIDVEAFDASMAVNARAPLMLIQRFAAMLGADYPQRAGRVVNFIDIHVMGEPLAGYMAYNASKAALQEVTMTAAMELAPKVTVNAIAPGVVAWADSYSPQQRRQYLERVPLGRAGTPEDAAAAVLFLLRDAGYCTGQVIRLDGGRLLT